MIIIVKRSGADCKSDDRNNNVNRYDDVYDDVGSAPCSLYAVFSQYTQTPTNITMARRYAYAKIEYVSIRTYLSKNRISV